MKKSPFIKRKIKKGYAWKNFFKEYRISTSVALGMICFSILGHDLVAPYSDYLRTSLIEIPSVPYQGAAFPIKKVPDWVNLTDSERLMSYDQIPERKLITLPDYNPKDFQAGKDWKNSTPAQRNAYISYPVPNLGNYLLDGTEYSGSHPGIDIKVPRGTPVYPSTAGVVFKTGDQPTGFGLHIVVQSEGVPNLEDPSKTMTIFTIYAHLSQINVKEGQIVSLQDRIGLSGDTGMATAPHLHWQIDRMGAPFHGYWPFTWNEVKQAGYNSYFEGVKHGLNQHLARENTLNPAQLVQKAGNLRDLNLLASSISNIPQKTPSIASPENDVVIDNAIPEAISEVKETPTPKEEIPKDTPREKEPKPTRTKMDIAFETDEIFTQGVPEKIILRFKKPLAKNTKIELTSTLRNLVEIDPKIITPELVQDGKVEVSVKTGSNQSFRLVAKGQNTSTKSPLLQAQIFADVAPNHRFIDAILFAKEQEIFKGYPDGTFGPEKEINRAEALKVILAFNELDPQHIPSNLPQDVASDTWFAGWVGRGLSNNVIKGYPDGTFRPGNSITRAEFLKIAILADGKSLETASEVPYSDVKMEDWFKDVVAFSKKYKLLPTEGNSFEPSKAITRAEAAWVLYQLHKSN